MYFLRVGVLSLEPWPLIILYNFFNAMVLPVISTALVAKSKMRQGTVRLSNSGYGYKPL